MVQGKITEADTPTIRLGATPSRLISDPVTNLHHLLRQMHFLSQPSHFILAWDRHQICWLAYPVVLKIAIKTKVVVMVFNSDGYPAFLPCLFTSQPL